eukprot:2030155-Lingulodinium_polyedra.AAC.1
MEPRTGPGEESQAGRQKEARRTFHSVARAWRLSSRGPLGARARVHGLAIQRPVSYTHLRAHET